MLSATETLQLTSHESVVVRSTAEDAIVVEALYAPGGDPPPKHLHPSQDERFEVLAGEMSARVDGADHVLRAGDVLEVPRGAVHQMWNAGGEPARVRWETSPAGRTLEWFRALSAAGGADRAGIRTLAALLREYDDVIRVAAGPQPIVRAGLAVLALGAPGARGVSPAQP